MHCFSIHQYATSARGGWGGVWKLATLFQPLLFFFLILDFMALGTQSFFLPCILTLPAITELFPSNNLSIASLKCHSCFQKVMGRMQGIVKYRFFTDLLLNIFSPLIYYNFRTSWVVQNTSIYCNVIYVIHINYIYIYINILYWNLIKKNIWPRIANILLYIINI